MDDDRARELLTTERARIEELLAETERSGLGDREAEADPGNEPDDEAQPLSAEGVDDAVAAGLRDRLGAIGRAEERLAAGSYGLSVRSGTPIPDERLEQEPAAELTVEEAAGA